MRSTLFCATAGQHRPSTNHRDDIWRKVLTQAGVDPH